MRTMLQAIAEATKENLIISFSDGDGALKLLVESVPRPGQHASFSECHAFPLSVIESADYESTVVAVVDQAHDALIAQLASYDQIREAALKQASIGIFGSVRP